MEGVPPEEAPDAAGDDLSMLQAADGADEIPTARLGGPLPAVPHAVPSQNRMQEEIGMKDEPRCMVCGARKSEHVWGPLLTLKDGVLVTVEEESQE